jgi:uncharacterized DUF497 family protein
MGSLDDIHICTYIIVMEFEWDQGKNLANYVKHKINFELAAEVFNDPLADYRFDRVVEDEERWHVVGKVLTSMCYLSYTPTATRMDTRLSG